MPLLTSPIDGSPMNEIERYGIKLDMCPTSGGIWFDKGEVEKLIHFVREETIKEQGEGSQAFHPKDSHTGHRDQTDIRKKRRKENPLSELMDIFEF